MHARQRRVYFDAAADAAEADAEAAALWPLCFLAGVDAAADADAGADAIAEAEADAGAWAEANDEANTVTIRAATSLDMANSFFGW